MRADYPSVAIGITAAIYAGFAVWLGGWPAALLEAFGVTGWTPAMLTEIRAFYGGVELGIAVAMVWLGRRGDRFAALLIGGLPLAGSAVGRCLGLAVDGVSPLHAGMALVDAGGAAFCLTGCWLIRGHGTTTAAPNDR